MAGTIKKRVDHRIKSLMDECVLTRHRSMIILIGKRGKSQMIHLHWLLKRSHSKQESPNLLWCYKDNLGFSPNHVKQANKIKKDIRRGLRHGNMDDPFESFILSQNIRYVKYKDSDRILGQTYQCLVLQDFNAISPNLLARTIETIEGGGLIVFLLENISNLQQLFTISMDCHKRFRTPSHSLIIPRFNERFTLSLADCNNCLICDDELNVLPITQCAKRLVFSKGSKNKQNKPKSKTSSQEKQAADVNEDDDEDIDIDIAIKSDESIDKSFETALSLQRESVTQLESLKKELADTKPVGDIISCCRTNDQAKCVLVFLESIADKSLMSTVVLTAARGRGKSAALGLAVAGAISLQYSNIFVTSPSPENLRSFFEVLLIGFDSLGYKESIDYEIIQSTNALYRRAIVRINIFKQHRQTIQYIFPNDYEKLSQAELVVIDEAAAIPLPMVKKLMGPYLVFLSSTVNGYEGTGRSLSLKLIQQLRKQSLNSISGSISSNSNSNSNKKKAVQSVNARKLREITLNEPIRYGVNDSVELWLNDLLCLNCCGESNTGGGNVLNSKYKISLSLKWHPDPLLCQLYYVNRDTLFSYNQISELFLQNMMSLYVSSHYKNEPNDLQIMSDAPAHQLFVLLPPQNGQSSSSSSSSNNGGGGGGGNSTIPNILCVLQVALEGNLTKNIISRALSQGKRLSGDLIPWIMLQQFQDNDFGRLSGARVVRIAVNPNVQGMGYGSRALQLLMDYFEGKFGDKDEDKDKDNNNDEVEEPEKKKRRLNADAKEKEKENEKGKGKDKKKGGKKNKGAEKGREKGKGKGKSNDLPPLLTPINDCECERLDWIGTSFGLTRNLFKFWKKNGYNPVYLRQTCNNVTGEYSCIMLKGINNTVINSSSKYNWLESFNLDFQKRFMLLMSFEFQKLDIVTALWVLNPNPNLLANNKNTSVNKSRNDNENSNNGGYLTYDEIMRMFSDWDLKRLETYCKSLIDYLLILDMIPKFSKLFFSSKMDIQLTYTQCAILLGIGLQHKTLNEIRNELSNNMPISQITAMLNKIIRKMQTYMDSIVTSHVKKTEIELQYSEAAQSSNAHGESDGNKDNITRAGAGAGVNEMQDPLVGLRSEYKQLGYIKEKLEKQERKIQEKEHRLPESQEVKMRKEKTRRKTLGHIKEYQIENESLDNALKNLASSSSGVGATKVDSKSGLVVNNAKLSIPDTISVKVSQKEVTFPKNENSNVLDPKHFQNLDKVQGIDPKSKYHWKQSKSKSKTKSLSNNRKSKKFKQRKNKNLEFVKKQKQANRTNRKGAKQAQGRDERFFAS